MKTLLATRYVTIPEGVNLEVKSRIVTVTGPRGELVQNFKHVNLDMQKAGSDKLRVDLWFGKRKQVLSVEKTRLLLGLLMTAVTEGRSCCRPFLVGLLRSALFLIYPSCNSSQAVVSWVVVFKRNLVSFF